MPNFGAILVLSSEWSKSSPVSLIIARNTTFRITGKVPLLANYIENKNHGTCTVVGRFRLKTLYYGMTYIYYVLWVKSTTYLADGFLLI